MSAGAAIAGWLLAGGLLALERGRARERAEELARISHELRGPLTAIGLALTAEHRGRQPAGAHVARPESVGAMEHELQRAAVVLRDLDDLAAGRRRVGMAPRTLEVVEVHGLLASSAGAWSAAAAARDTELRPPRPPAPPAVVLGDPGRLAQAAGNLIANAVEHGGGVVRVGCRCRGDRVRIEVSDDGAGLPAPVEQLIRRPRAGRGRRGRGLAIAAEIAAAHGGRLSAAPSRTGARLVLELPRAPGWPERDHVHRLRPGGTRGGRNEAGPARRRPDPRPAADLARCARCSPRGMEGRSARPRWRSASSGGQTGAGWEEVCELGCKVGDSGLQWDTHADGTRMARLLPPSHPGFKFGGADERP